jgi:hypothetical protein
MQRMTLTHFVALALLAACAAALGARAALLLAVLLPLVGAVLLLDGRRPAGGTSAR